MKLTLTHKQKAILKFIVYSSIVLSIPGCKTTKIENSNFKSTKKEISHTRIVKDTVINPKPTVLDFKFPADSTFGAIVVEDSTGTLDMIITKTNGVIGIKTKSKPKPFIIPKVFIADSVSSCTKDSSSSVVTLPPKETNKVPGIYQFFKFFSLFSLLAIGGYFGFKYIKNKFF